MQIAFFLIAATGWLITLRDITKSEYTDDSKTKWLVLVIITGYIGMMFYYFYGIKRKAKKFKFIK